MDIHQSMTRKNGGKASFNGAMTFQPWIFKRMDAVEGPSVFLQWSHDLSAMDISRAQYLIGDMVLPSMEP